MILLSIKGLARIIGACNAGARAICRGDIEENAHWVCDPAVVGKTLVVLTDEKKAEWRAGLFQEAQSAALPANG
jgi:hypothetical protein